MATRYVVKVGETLGLRLRVVEGSTQSKSIITTVRASLKRTLNNGAMPPQNAHEAARFVVTDIDDGWEFTLTSSITRSLAPGLYMMDALVVASSGQVIITNPVEIEVRSSIS